MKVAEAPLVFEGKCERSPSSPPAVKVLILECSHTVGAVALPLPSFLGPVPIAWDIGRTDPGVCLDHSPELPAGTGVFSVSALV